MESVQNITPTVDRPDQIWHHLAMLRRPLTNFVTIAVLAFSGAAGAHPLEDAVADATAKCQAVGAIHLEQCAGLPIRSPEASAARRAVSRAAEQRNAFVRSCESSGSGRCTDQAEWHVGAGMSRVLNTPVVRLP